MMTSSIRRGLVLSIGLACAALAAKAQNAAQLVPPGSRAAVLYCVASDCPISNRTLPEMKRLERLRSELLVCLSQCDGDGCRAVRPRSTYGAKANLSRLRGSK